MSVIRIVSNIQTDNIDTAKAFYGSLFDLDVKMDLGWVVTLHSGTSAPVQISFASEGGSGSEVPDLSIEVEDVDKIHRRAIESGCDIPYGIVDEPWGVRRFYVRDPFGKLLNVLSHSNDESEK